VKKYELYDDNLKDEAAAFDSQIIQRVKGGHIPDIDNVESCDYFYNNPWRRKYYAELDFGEQCDLIINSLRENLDQKPEELKILEVGSGPGYMSLSLARKGYHVTGLELSLDCIDVAVATAEKYSPGIIGSNLEYVCDDFFNFSESHFNEFDVVLFVGTMHHFSNQEEINLTCKKILKHNGLLICHEPVRDCVTKRNATVNLLICTLLAVSGSYFKKLEEGYEKCIQANVERIFNELRYESEGGEKTQSINDNEAGFNEMSPLLHKHFNKVDFQWRYGVFHEIIGGIRLDSDDNEAKLAQFIRDIDKVMCQENVVDPTEFFFVGRNN
jgi:2-polyprenyl-3-methyl-5-hydroxy-6-metoxy-1,4-benzoquinol methylase